MRSIKWTLIVILALLFIILAIAFIGQKAENAQISYLRIEHQPDLQSNSYVIRNTNVVPMTTDTVLLNMDVEITDGMITRIDSNINAGGTAVLDADGGYLTPGLIDMHMHLWDRFELGLYVANGVTTVRSLLGMPMHIAVKREIQSGRIIGPEFYTSSPQFSGPDDEDILKKPVKSPEEGRKLVRSYEAQGYDYIKTYNLLPEDIFDSVLDECKKLNMAVVAHPSFRVDYSYHFNPIIRSIEHTEDIYQQPLNYTYDRVVLDSVVSGYARSGQSHCPTLTVFHNLTRIYNDGEEFLSSESAGYINPFIRWASDDYKKHSAIREQDSSSIERINRQHEFHIEILGRLHRAGVNIICGTDAGIVNTAAGFSIHDELQFYTRAGMSNYEALRTATVNPRQAHPEYAIFGTVEENKLANLILSKDNPLEDLRTLRNPKWVMIRGRLIDEKRIDEFKRRAYNRKNVVATLTRVARYIAWEK